jgi:ATP-binding cassette subfamily B protein
VLVQTMGGKIHERFERIQAMFSDISAQAQENFSGARLVRAFAQEEAQIASFETANRENVRRGLRLVQLMGMLWPTLEFILGLSLAITLLVGGHEVLSGRISVGQFVAFNTYMMMLTWPIIALGWVVNLVQRGTASVIRIDELMKEKPTIDDVAADTTLGPETRLKGKIEFRHLNFAYTDTEGKPVEVLHDINLEIPAGTSLAIVGPTGSGKSTLVGLIARIYDADPAAPEDADPAAPEDADPAAPEDADPAAPGDADPGDAAPGDAEPGTVLIDDRPVRAYPLATLRANIGFVPQETFLFSESIRENIAFGAPQASTEDVLAAAEAAHIRREFEEFPHGLDTAVGERGLTLSGGQKQRTAIARAVVRDPAILVLDDALASVDTYTEETILRQLREVMRDRTTIFISHRISTVRHADRIAVLVNGRIAELGTHEELLSVGHFYASLYEKQLLEEELAVAGD